MSKSLLVSFIISLTFITSMASANSKDIQFQRACERGTKITISAVGDLLLHGGLQSQAYESRDGFKSLWREAIPYFREADIAYANLEGPVADGVKCNGSDSGSDRAVLGQDCRKSRNSVYTSYPRFNYHSSLVDDLLDSGIGIVSTANNHSLDRFSTGANATIEALDDGGLPFTGTRENANSNRPWHKITRVKGKKIAWLSCTYGTNGIADKQNQVLGCFSGNTVANLIARLKNSVDAVIVTPHWGNEYQPNPSSQQKRFAKAWLDAGATAIIGAHPHVVQPWEKYVTRDGRETVIVYSLGNFVSGQGAFAKKATIIFFLGLTISRGEAWVNGVRYAPAYMARTNSGRSLFVDSVHRSSIKSDLLPFLSRFFGNERIVLPNEDVLTNAECY